MTTHIRQEVKGQVILGLCNLLIGMGVALFVLKQMQEIALEAFFYRRMPDLMLVLVPLFAVSIAQFIGGILVLRPKAARASTAEVKRRLTERPAAQPKAAAPLKKSLPEQLAAKPKPVLPEAKPQVAVKPPLETKPAEKQPDQTVTEQKDLNPQAQQKITEEVKPAQDEQEKLKEEEHALEELRRLLGLPPEEAEKAE